MAARARLTPDRDSGSPAGTEPRRGHAFHAAAARQALGIHGSVGARVAQVPAPAFCAVVAVAASGVAVLARPQVVERFAAIALDAGLVVVTCLAISTHARLKAATGERLPGLEAMLLAVAALAALFTTLAGTDNPVVGAVAVAGCALVTGMAPHLHALRAAGRERLRTRVLRDAGGTLVMLPAALAGASEGLAWESRMGVVMLLAWLTTAEAVPALRNRRALGATLIVALAAALGTLPAAHAASQATGATGVLLLWYGLRGVGSSLLVAPRERVAAVEYLAVALGAAALLVSQTR